MQRPGLGREAEVEATVESTRPLSTYSPHWNHIRLITEDVDIIRLPMRHIHGFLLAGAAVSSGRGRPLSKRQAQQIAELPLWRFGRTNSMLAFNAIEMVVNKEM